MKYYCSCSRRFESEAAREQHQADKNRDLNGRGPCRSISGADFLLSIANNTPSNVAQAENNTGYSPPVRAEQRTWLWKQIRRPADPVHTIAQSAIVPSTVAVSSEAGYQLVCSYNWQSGRPRKIRVPEGYAAICQDMSLPLTLPPDRGIFYSDPNTELLPRHPFEPMFRAAVAMNPDVSFDNIDVVTNRTSLRKLLDFCAGRSGDCFRLNLHLVRNTLIVERCDKNTREFKTGSRDGGWGRHFEKASANYPAGLRQSLSHHRTLRYSIGALSCAVQFEVDASYEQDNKAGPLDGLVPRMETVSIPRAHLSEAKSPWQGLQVETAYAGARVMDQSTTAELKSSSKNKNINYYMSQLWFGRTPWIIVGLHTEGTFDSRRITDVTDRFAEWEVNNQEILRKLVTVLGELRTAIQKNGGRHCAAVFARGSGIIGVFDLMSVRQAVPMDLRQKLWT
ncbi:hypothetical protein LY76DRAFT_667131 [Colletotrichum caudatum]|nr:hypothetical protein LY76DRAFT_667131 [Colletotrichum caudatum]